MNTNNEFIFQKSCSLPPIPKSKNREDALTRFRSSVNISRFRSRRIEFLIFRQSPVLRLSSFTFTFESIKRHFAQMKNCFCSFSFGVSLLALFWCSSTTAWNHINHTICYTILPSSSRLRFHFIHVELPLTAHCRQKCIKKQKIKRQRRSTVIKCCDDGISEDEKKNRVLATDQNQRKENEMLVGIVCVYACVTRTEKKGNQFSNGKSKRFSRRVKRAQTYRHISRMISWKSPQWKWIFDRANGMWTECRCSSRPMHTTGWSKLTKWIVNKRDKQYQINIKQEIKLPVNDSSSVWMNARIKNAIRLRISSSYTFLMFFFCAPFSIAQWFPMENFLLLRVIGQLKI